MPNLRISELIQRAPDGTEFLEVIIPPFTPGTNRKVLLQDILDMSDPAGSASTVATNLSNHISDTSAAHAASSISNTPFGTLGGTDVQTAINELEAAKLQYINSAVALTDASTMDLTAIKHTLTTSSATRTFTISYIGDDISMKVILNAASSVFTFPAGALCVNSDGESSGDNTCALDGVSGDVYVFAIKNWGSSAYTVVCKNTLQ